MSFIKHPSLADRLVSCFSFCVLATRCIPLISATKPLQILLVQRAAHEKVYPGFYEGKLQPSHVEDSDKTILDAAVREAAEETGLIMSNIVGEIPPLEYSVEKMLAAEGAVPTAIVRSTMQLNFVAQVVPFGSTNALEVKQKCAGVGQKRILKGSIVLM